MFDDKKILDKTQRHRELSREHQLRKRLAERNKYCKELEPIIGKPIPDWMPIRGINILLNELGRSYDGNWYGDTGELLVRVMNMPESHWLRSPNCGKKTTKLILQYLHGEIQNE